MITFLLLPKNQAEPVKHLGQFWISTYPLSGSVFGQRQQQGAGGWRTLQLGIKLEKLKLQIKMKPSLALATHRSEIREIVLAHRAVNARVFGSVAQGLDTDLSDLDILVDTTSETTLFDLGAIRFKLRNLLDVPVDVLTPGALPDSFRQTVIAQAQPI